MLGNAMVRFLAEQSAHTVVGTVRSKGSPRPPLVSGRGTVVAGVDVTDMDTVATACDRAEATVVINCVGVVKQLAQSDDPLQALPINSLLPHQLARLCADRGSRLVHVSTDCVFSGRKGNYREDDFADADDLYGRSKYLGEVGTGSALTLRTSIIGHELETAHGLVDWFLSRQGRVKGFTRAIFSGLPTVELARVVRDHVLVDPGLSGVYHVSAAPISKFDLLRIVAEVYERDLIVEPDDVVTIDRSLDSTRFRDRTGYRPADWPTLVRQMRAFA